MWVEKCTCNASLSRFCQHRKLAAYPFLQYKRAIIGKGAEGAPRYVVYNVNNSLVLIRIYCTQVLALCVLTPSSAESAYSHVSGICCCYLQGGSEWCVLWSVYVGMRIASETHVISGP